MDELWLFVEHGPNNIWTRAQVPAGVKTVRDLVGYLQRGGRITSEWMQIPERARFTPRVAGATVLARIENGHQEPRHNS